MSYLNCIVSYNTWEKAKGVAIEQGSPPAASSLIFVFKNRFVGLRNAAKASKTGKVLEGVEGYARRTFEVDSRQLGRKLGKHIRDFGLDPANPAHRTQIIDLINDITRSPERSVPGTFRGQGPGGTSGPVEFRIKGNNVVVMTPDGKFVTILKDGINNPSVAEALNSAGG